MGICFLAFKIKTIKGFNLSCDRIFSIMDEKKFSKEKFGKLHLDTINGDFEFRDISFSYDNERNVNANLKPILEMALARSGS